MSAQSLFVCLATLGAWLSLPQDVRSYWDALQQRDKETAAGWVTTESRRHFMGRSEPLFRQWRLGDIRRIDSDEALVTVLFERWVGRGWFNWKMQERWLRTDSGWKVQIPDGAEARRGLFRRDVEAPIRGQELRVYPATLRFHLLDRSAARTLLISNGTSQPAIIRQAAWDEDLFTLAIPAKTVPPGGSLSLPLRFKGTGEAREAASMLVLSLECGGRSQRFEVRIVYNYLSPAAKALGLSGEQSRRPSPEGTSARPKNLGDGTPAGGVKHDS